MGYRSRHRSRVPRTAGRPPRPAIAIDRLRNLPDGWLVLLRLVAGEVAGALIRTGQARAAGALARASASGVNHASQIRRTSGGSLRADGTGGATDVCSVASNSHRDARRRRALGRRGGSWIEQRSMPPGHGTKQWATRIGSVLMGAVIQVKRSICAASFALSSAFGPPVRPAPTGSSLKLTYRRREAR